MEWVFWSRSNFRDISCPFCYNKGNFSRVHHEEKTKQNSQKTLNFDTYKCENCANFVLIFWAKAEFDAIHSFKMIPFPLKISSAPES